MLNARLLLGEDGWGSSGTDPSQQSGRKERDGHLVLMMGWEMLMFSFRKAPFACWGEWRDMVIYRINGEVDQGRESKTLPSPQDVRKMGRVIWLSEQLSA